MMRSLMPVVPIFLLSTENITCGISMTMSVMNEMREVTMIPSSIERAIMVVVVVMRLATTKLQIKTFVEIAGIELRLKPRIELSLIAMPECSIESSAQLTGIGMIVSSIAMPVCTIEETVP